MDRSGCVGKIYTNLMSGDVNLVRSLYVNS